MYIRVRKHKSGTSVADFSSSPSTAYSFHPTQISLKRLVQYSSASQSQSIWGWVYVRDEGGGSSPSICTIQNSWQLLYTVPAVSVQSQPCTVWGGSHLHSEKPSCFFSLCLPCRSSIADESVFLFIFIFFFPFLIITERMKRKRRWRVTHYSSVWPPQPLPLSLFLVSSQRISLGC